MLQKKFKNLLIFSLLVGGFFLVHFALAQNLGINAVATGLNNSLSSSDPREIIAKIINISLGFLGLIAISLIIYAGFIWMTSNGEEEKVSQAKKILRNSIIGLVIILSSWAIATFVISRLSNNVDNSYNNTCISGEVSACGCGGSITCSNGSWGDCIGSDCNGTGGPTTCDSSASSGCQSLDAICSPDDYCGDSCLCQAKGGLGDSCSSAPGEAACQADNNRCADYLTCDTSSCLCVGSPVILGISPAGGFCEENHNQSCAVDSDCSTTCDKTIPNGAVGNFITISGKNFGKYVATSSKVMFLGNNNPQEGQLPSKINPACIDSWRDSQIIIAVPSGAENGPVKVISSDNKEDSSNDKNGPLLANFEVNTISRPGLCSLSPNQGTLSSEVSYQGVNLYSSNAYFGNYEKNVQALDSSFNHPAGLSGFSIIPNVKSGDSSSFVINSINGSPERSNYLDFTKKNEANSGPYIMSFSPVLGAPGQYVTIKGSGFGGARGDNHVYFGDTEANYNFPSICANSVWHDNQIIVKVPAGMTDNNYLLKISLGKNTIDSKELNPNTFKIDNKLEPGTSICKIIPSLGAATTPVTVYGEYFGKLGREKTVQFSPGSDQKAYGKVGQEQKADLIKVKVPLGSITGPVKVLKNGLWGNEINFEVGQCENDSECGAQICCPQDTYKKGRCSDNLADCSINIPNSVFEWNFSTKFNDSGGDSYCSTFNKNGTECIATGACCFDSATSNCLGSARIKDGANAGYCAHYSCESKTTNPPGDPTKCNQTPSLTGPFVSTDTCITGCTNGTGDGSYCSSFNGKTTECITTGTCCFDSSTKNCLGSPRIKDGANTGYCAYYNCENTTTNPPGDPSKCNATPSLSGSYTSVDTCTAGCSGGTDVNAEKCGCSTDQDCGQPATIGCGADTCCETRPKVVSTVPANLQKNVCRNASLQVKFDQVMDATTFNRNITLVEEKSYGNGVCPAGTFVYNVNQLKKYNNQRWLALAYDYSKTYLSRLFTGVNPVALADNFDANKLYCAIPGNVMPEQHNNQTILIFSPQKLLAPAANYYLIVKGDEALNSQSGVLSIKEIGLNGPGFDSGNNVYTEGVNLRFNKQVYKNSHIIKFTTLADNSTQAGICTVSKIKIFPNSYLFNNTSNDLNEDDSNAQSSTFDTVADKDKVFSAWAYASNDQILHSVKGYAWEWKWQLDDSSVATIKSIPQLPANNAFVSVAPGVTNAETKLHASISMKNFQDPLCSNNANCSNNCCNALSNGDNLSQESNIYVFVCNNPWPAIDSSGNWYPWADNCNNATGTCSDYNYKFYYCRDSGNKGTQDDLPAITDKAIILGQSNNFVCSSDKTPCTKLASRCGPDQTGDGVPDGVCIRNVLKESYFFRETILPAGKLISATNLKTGGAVYLTWKSAAKQVSYYDIYYHKTGSSSSLAKTLDRAYCNKNNGNYDCGASINGLDNNQSYTFGVSVVSVDGTESPLSNEKQATPSDITSPTIPANLTDKINNENITFSWTANTDDTLFYRLYWGVNSGQYGESLDSAQATSTLVLTTSRFSGVEYFVLSALDASGNESAKSNELMVDFSKIK